LYQQGLLFITGSARESRARGLEAQLGELLVRFCIVPEEGFFILRQKIDKLMISDQTGINVKWYTKEPCA
jgi:hypothetical protein